MDLNIEEDENQLSNMLSFKTDYFLSDLFDSPQAQSFFTINPQTIKWNYTILSCFLSQLNILTKRKRNPFYAEEDKDGNKTHIFTFVYESPEDEQSSNQDQQIMNIQVNNVNHSNSVLCPNQGNPDDISDISSSDFLGHQRIFNRNYSANKANSSVEHVLRDQSLNDEYFSKDDLAETQNDHNVQQVNNLQVYNVNHNDSSLSINQNDISHFNINNFHSPPRITMPHNNRNDTNSFILNVSNNQNLNNEHTIQDNITEPHQNTKQKKVKQPVELIIKINSNISVIASL